MSINPSTANEFLGEVETSLLRQQVKAIDLVRRPQITLFDLLQKVISKTNSVFESEIDMALLCEATEIHVKYFGYIEREQLIAEKVKRLENIRIPDHITYNDMLSISTEARQS